MYRKEHPKPQFCRKNWQNLNGEWEFEFDHADSGREHELFSPTAVFERVINVPFCPQSKLSGIGETDFLRAVWYRRHFTLDEKTAAGRVVLHFGAVDYEAYIYVNGALSVYGTNFMYLVRPPLEGLPYLNLESGWYAYFLRLIALGAAIVTVFHLPFLVRERRGKKEREAAR